MSKVILMLLFFLFTILVSFEYGRQQAMETAKGIMDKAFIQTKELIHTQIEQAKETADENETTD